MKKVLLSLLVVFTFGATATAQQSGNIKVKFPKEEPKSGAIMKLESEKVDYGTIDQHSEPLRVLKFKNTGTEPLVIKTARGSCGCTVPIWPKEPIAPGEESQIEVRYATNRVGKFSKKITITTNQSNTPVVIQVVGNVLKKEKEVAVPAAAPSLLKKKGTK